MFWHESIRITDWFLSILQKITAWLLGMELFEAILPNIPHRCCGLIIWYLVQTIVKIIRYIVPSSLILAAIEISSLIVYLWRNLQ